MAGFGRSNSLSINTGGSLFGNNTNTSQGQQSAGLFGSSTANASSQPASTGGLFGSSSQTQTGGLFGGVAATQPPQSGSLFGGTQQASQPQPSGGLFGNVNKPAATGASTGGLFGSSTAGTASQPQQTGGLFGGALGGNAQQNQNQNQNQGTSQSGGLFNLGQSQTQQKPSLFGASTTQQTTTPSLFGNTQNQQNQTSGPSLFGSTQQNQQPQQQQQSNSLFGGMASQNKPFGGLGGQASQQPIQVQAFDMIKGTTRFNELHPDIQAEVQKLDDQIQYHMSNAKKVKEILPKSADMVASIAPDVLYIQQLLSTVELGLDNDSSQIKQLKDLTERDAKDALLSFRVIENQALPEQFRYTNRSNLNASTVKPQPTSSREDDDDPTKPVDLVSYFSKRVDEQARTFDVYGRQISEIEAHLRTMEAGTLEKAHQLTGNRSGVRDQKRELIEALRAIEGAIMDAAKKVGNTRDMVMQQTLSGAGASVL